MVSLPEDPLEVIAANEMHRRRDRPLPCGLYTVDEWSTLFPCCYTNRVPTFAPDRWHTSTPLTQAEYTRMFTREYPEVARILSSVRGLCVAGGAAVWPFLQHDSSAGDVDFFVLGAEYAPSLMAKAEEFARALRTEFADASISEALTTGLVTFVVWRDGNCTKIQLILRAFRDTHELLYGFDIGSCCVGFDGETTHMTVLAMYALLHRVNIVHPMYRSISFEARLAKYFHRGIALALPFLRDGALVAGTTLALPHMTLRPRFVRGRFATGTVTTDDGNASDYEGSARQTRKWLMHPSSRQARIGVERRNIEQVASEGTDFVVFGAGLPLATYAATALSTVLPLSVFERHIDRAIASVVTSKGVDVACLRRLLRLTDDEVSTFTVAACDALCRRGARRIDASAALSRFRSALVVKYRAAESRPIEWCIVVDPQRQYTATRNPTPESDRAWYGEHAFSSTPPAASSDESIRAIFGRLEARQLPATGPNATETCALCQCDVTPGDRNAVRLECGHTYHFAKEEESGCKGLLTWVAMKRREATCPMCRQDLTSGAATRATTGRASVRLEVDWHT